MEGLQQNTGYPLSYFAGTSPFDRFFERVSRYVPNLGQAYCEPGKSPDDTQFNLPEWAAKVWLMEFGSRVADADKRERDATRGLTGGGREFILRFISYTPVRMLLTEPSGVVSLFGHDQGAELNLLLSTDRRGALERIQIAGDVTFRLPRGLAGAVTRRGDSWVPADPRYLEISLGQSVISLQRGAAPRLSAPLNFPSETYARIGSSPLVARLGGLDLAGPAEQPKLKFFDVEIMDQRRLDAM